MNVAPLDQFRKLFPSLAKDSLPLRAQSPTLAKDFVGFLLIQLNLYGQHLQKILDDPRAFEMQLTAWTNGLGSHTPRRIMEILLVFINGKASISSRYDCPMPKTVVEYCFEINTNQHQSSTYDEYKPSDALKLTHDSESAKERADKANAHCMPIIKQMLAAAKRCHKGDKSAKDDAILKGPPHILEDRERAELLLKRKEFFDEQFQKHGRIMRDCPF